MVSNTRKVTNIEARCAEKGMRMTEQRRTIARVLNEADDHPDVEELYRRCAKIDDRISISTVYRTVKLFEDSGIIERHDFREGRARFEQISDAHHDHLRFAWELGPAEGPPLARGVDFGRIVDGRLEAITGILDAAPSLNRG